jgi:hypothetical protein
MPGTAHGPEALLIGGRAGVDKTSVAEEVSALLRRVAVPHAVIEGDFLAQVHPVPEGDPHRSLLTARNQRGGARRARRRFGGSRSDRHRG